MDRKKGNAYLKVIDGKICKVDRIDEAKKYVAQFRDAGMAWRDAQGFHTGWDLGQRALIQALEDNHGYKDVTGEMRVQCTLGELEDLIEQKQSAE